VRSLMTALEHCLDTGEDDLIIDQVISDMTRQEYRGRSEDPRAVLKFLRFHRKDLALLFARMPMAEHTPTVILEQPGDRMWTLRLTGAAAKDLELTKLWARLEQGNWRFVWVE